MKLSNIAMAVAALTASNLALAFEPAKAQPKLSDLTPKYTYTPDNGPGKMPPPPPPPPQTYPKVQQAPNGDPRLYVNKDVSVGGSLSPMSANVQFPIPETKKGK